MSNAIRSTFRRRHVLRSWAATGVSLAVVAGCSAGGASSATSATADGSTTAGGSAATATVAKTAALVESGSLFDDSVVHAISLTIDEAAYDAMIAEFVESGEKTWIEATVTIDGVTYEHVGIRLKGNSSLMGIRNAGGPSNSNASAEDPETLPWLVRLDKYVDGQDHHGITELVIRSNNSETSLNEAIALELIGLTGQATQEAVATKLTVNGSDATLRLVVENPGEDWDDDNFATDGILYKAESGGDYSYRGDDAAAYEDVFDQETGDEDDLAPLIAFLKFINESDDATFASDLGTYLDVESFAKYLAVQELVQNDDDIDGPGNNSYLRYDETTGRITILSWDQNLSFGGLRTMGGGGAGGGAGAFGGQMPAAGATRDARPAMGGGPAGTAGAVGGGAGGSRSNVLVTRFLANATFRAAYDAALADLQTTIVDDGTAAEVIAKWKTLLLAQATDVVDAATIEQEAAAIATTLGI